MDAKYLKKKLKGKSEEEKIKIIKDLALADLLEIERARVLRRYRELFPDGKLSK